MTQKRHTMHGRDHSPGGMDPLRSSGANPGDVLTADGTGGIEWAAGGGGGGGTNDPWVRHAFYKSASCVYNAGAHSFYMTWNPTPVHGYDGTPSSMWIWLQPDHRYFQLINPCIVEFTLWLYPGFYITVPSGNDKSNVQWRAFWDVFGYDLADGSHDGVGTGGMGIFTHWEWAGSYGGTVDVNRAQIRGNVIISRSSMSTTNPVDVSGGFEGDPAWLQGQTPSWSGYLLAKKLSPW